jgi:hypothetical protein
MEAKIILLFVFFIIFPFNDARTREDHIGKRCRTKEDFDRIPWLDRTSTFHNLGRPLIASLCTAIKSDLDWYSRLGCKSIENVTWEKDVHFNCKNGSESSMIVVDPHMSDTVSASSGVFVFHGIYAIFHKLGFKVGVRHWAQNLNNLFSKEVHTDAQLYSTQWDKYNEGQGVNPFKAELSYISFQCEIGLQLYDEDVLSNGFPLKDINDSPFGRAFRWIIGYHDKFLSGRYQVKIKERHCSGANHFLGEGMHCSNAEVIGCPMFPLHHEKSRDVTEYNRPALKQNIVLADGDAFAKELFDKIKDALFMLDPSIQLLLHKDRTREEVPEWYKIAKVTIDCRNPGVEFINYEAVLYDVITLSCDSRATRNAFDFPVPSMYRLEPTDVQATARQLHALVRNYPKHIKNFKYFKSLVRNSQSKIETQLNVHFFARDVLFRYDTHIHTEGFIVDVCMIA